MAGLHLMPSTGGREGGWGDSAGWCLSLPRGGAAGGRRRRPPGGVSPPSWVEGRTPGRADIELGPAEAAVGR